MTPSEITDTLFPHDTPHSKICLRCQLNSLRRTALNISNGMFIASSRPTQALLPHELIEWLGRPVHENDIVRVFGPYRDLVICEDWYMRAFAHVMKEYAYYAFRYHPRGDVPDELLKAVGKMFVWQCSEFRDFDELLKKEPIAHEIESFIR